jgi:hypothetical protein
VAECRNFPAGLGYLEHLTAGDLALLARIGLMAGTDVAAGVTQLRARPEVVEQLLADARVFEAVFSPPGRLVHPFLHASAFLVFALAVARTAQDLDRLTYIHEWAGPRQRIPVFGTEELRGFMDEPLHRLFLAQLLSSYTHVASGSMWVQTARGPRRCRFSELDLLRLALLLETLPEDTHAGVYRRLGDLALLLTGVFGDHTASRLFRSIDVQRLARAAQPAGARPDADRLAEALAVGGAVGLLEYLGERWYRLAVRAAAHPSAEISVVETVAERFGQARRVLNHLTDRYLFPFRDQWFPTAGEPA